jgi:CRISPR-associated protein Csx14
MADASIPVDLLNPGQVLACLGFLEVAEVLLGDAEGGFDWSRNADICFRLRAKGNRNPVAVVLRFLAGAEIRCYAPHGFADPQKKEPMADDDGVTTSAVLLDSSDTFPCPAADTMALPILLVGLLNDQKYSVHLGHWADASSRNNFKLYSGNRSAADIARAMLLGTREKPKKKQNEGEVRTRGVSALWQEHGEELTAHPFDVLTPIGGSFNFDPRGAWTGIDAGYSPNDQKHGVAASPVVEILAALGLEHARPDEFDTRRVRYAVWGSMLSPVFARAALAGARLAIPLRLFHFTLDLSGKNKVVTFAQEEIQ